MADLVRTRDWSMTPLGALDNWPESLRCSVNMMLATHFPCTFYWGAEMIQFYNDAYLPLMGEKHPVALGQRAEECWPEAWEIIGPQLNAVLARGETVYQENVVVPVVRHGRLQNIYWIYSYSPIYLPDGQVGGIFVVCHDTTEQVLAERRLRESEARAVRILQSIGDAVIVTDTETRVTRMNPVAEALTGWKIEDALHRPLSEIFHIVNQNNREAVENPADKVKRLGTVVGLANHTILIAKDGRETFIDDSGAPIRNDEGELTGIVLVFRDITERRATERQRDALQRQLEQVLSATTDAILSLDRNWRITYMNQHARDLLAPSGEVMGSIIWESFPGIAYENSPFESHYHAAMAGETPGAFEAWYAEPLNFWISVQARPSEDGIIVFFRDITRQRQEAEALRESEARLSAIYATSIAHIGLLSPDGTILDFNRESLTFAGTPREEVIGIRFWDGPWFRYTPGGPDLARSLVKQAATGETVRRELSLIRPSGDIIDFNFSISPIRNENGDVIFLVPEAHDITRLKRAEAELAESREELRWTVELSIPVPWTADTAGNILEFSRYWLELTGLTREEALGSGWQQVPHPEDLPRMAAAWTKALKTGEPYDVEHRIRTASGEFRWMRSRAFPRRDEAGSILKWYGTTEDIDERKRAEDALIRSEKLAAVGRLAASIAHEINNPLEAVFNLLYLAEHSTELKDIQHFIKTSERELRRVSAITNQTLRFYKQSSSPRAVTGVELVDSVLGIYQGRIVNSNIEIVRRHRQSSPLVCFEGEIRQVLLNLIGNAIDAMHPAGGMLLLRSREATHWQTGAKGLMLTVADTGTGMDAATIHRVFEPFFTTKGFGGTGLGLWVSQEIVERHHGHLRVRSGQREERHGTVFTLFLPFQIANRDAG